MTTKTQILLSFFLNTCIILTIFSNAAFCDTETCSQSELSPDDGSECNGYVHEWEFYDNATIANLYRGDCNIDKVGLITNEDFLRYYAYTKPVIFVGVNNNDKFHRLSTKKSLLERYSERTITLSTANTHSYRKVQLTLSEYINRILKPQSETQLGKDTLYFFGDNNHTEWKDLFDEYLQPPYSLPQKTGAYSFGIAGAGTGVPFHFHGPGFSEVIHGSKRWFLYPYEEKPSFDPDQNVLRWVLEEYPVLSKEKKPLECTIEPGDVLYFPDRWWHSTFNLKTSVFMSTFLG